MNSLANLNSVVDEQGDSATWASEHAWDPPVATIYTGALSDTRLHYQHGAAASRQEWNWTDSQMLLAPHYAAGEDELDCKQGFLQVDAMGAGSSGLGLRPQYQSSAGFMAAQSLSTASPAAGGSTSTGGQSSWPGSLLSAVPLRQQLGLAAAESAGGSCYSSPGIMYGGGMGSNIGLAESYFSSSNATHQPQLQMDMEQRRLHDLLKRGMYAGGGGAGADLSGGGRLGLNLGGRTYFSTEDMSARFHLAGAGKRFRPNSPSMHVPNCQAEGCKADLSIAKHYHRRHKVCEYHSKASTVIITGNTQRFCQQCSRFHALSEFDEGKRSCRKRLADHNRRRRKPQPAPPLAALPAPASSTDPMGTAEGASSIDNNASNPTEDQPADTKPAITNGVVGKSQSEQTGDKQPKEQLMEGTKTPSSSSAEHQTTSLLSTISLAPSVSLTLQNGAGLPEMPGNPTSRIQVSSNDNSEIKEASYLQERHSAAPFLFNGPSLSLSSNGMSVGGAGDSVQSTNHQSPSHATHTFTEGELSVSWLTGRPHVSSSPRMELVQEGLGKLSSCHQAADGSLVYSSGSRRNGTGQYFNEHGRLLAERLQSLHSQVRNSSPNAQDHHRATKKEEWGLESAAAAHGDQIVLSLLETAAENARGRSKEQTTDPVDYNRHMVSAMDADQAHESVAGARHSLGFLQGHQYNYHHQHHHHHPEQQLAGLHRTSASPSDMADHEATDHAALSLHCMQVLRPLNESLYTTADFMKDGFLSS